MLKLLSFDPFRSAGIPGVTYVKPELVLAEKERVLFADWLLFPEYWQVNFLSYAWKKRIFPSLNSYHLGHDKVEMTRALQAIMPENVPHTLIAANNEDTKERILERFSYPFVAKEVRSSMGKGVFLINSAADLDRYLGDNETVYIQEYLTVDRDIRVVYVGRNAVAAYWRVGREGFKNNVAQGGKIDFSAVPRDVIDLVERACRVLGIDHAGFDIAVVDGHQYIFEFNVLFGTQALAEAGISLGSTIYDYISELSSTGPPKPELPAPKAS